MSAPVDVFDGPGPRRWSALPRRRKAVVVGVAVLLLVGGLSFPVHAWQTERRLREAVVLASSLDVGTSMYPAGGSVNLSVAVRNGGPRPVSLEGLQATSAHLAVRLRDGGGRRIGPGQQAQVPVSARLTCGAEPVPGADRLAADVRVRRADGGEAVRHVPLSSAEPLLDVAATLCAVRPQLRDVELSGPVVPGS